MLAALASLFVCAATLPASSEGPPPILQPATYRSPDGHFTLDVDPSRRDGGGPGTYVLKKDGANAWNGTKPWTLWEGVVTDSGLVAGYAYTEGWRDYKTLGEFHAVILSPKGDVLTDVKVKRTGSNFMHSPPDPLGACVLHVPASNRVFVGVGTQTGTGQDLELWCFQLPDGKELFRKKPKDALEEDEHTAGLHGLRVVTGTPLILTHWGRPEFGAGRKRMGGRFALFDSDLQKQWEVVRADDCSMKDEDEEDRIWNLSWKGALLPETSESGRFAIWAPASGERLNYQVASQAVARDGAASAKPTWTVSELESQPYQEPAIQQPPEVPSIQLTQRGVSSLEGAGAKSDSPLGEIVEFAPESATTMRVVRRGQQPGEFTLLHVDLACQVLSQRDVVLEGLGAEQHPQWFPVTDHSWIVTEPKYGPAAKATASCVDDRTGAVQRLEAFDCPPVSDVAGFGDGRFVVLATERAKYTSQEFVIAFDAKGAQQWKLGEEFDSESEAAIFAPEAIAVTSSGNVCVLDNIRKSIQIFDAGGKFKQLVDLEKAFGQEPNYPSGLEWDTDGGVLLDDFGGKPRLWRLDAAGVVKKKVAPRFADGREIEDLPRNARVAPDGRVWSTDGGRLYRLDDQGVVDLEIGAKLSADVLGEAAATAIDQFGRALIQDEKTGAVHVFDENGKRLFVCKPEAKDVGNTNSIARLAALKDGGVIVPLSRTSYLTFDKLGKRSAVLKELPDDVVVSPVTGTAAGGNYGGQIVLLDDAWKTTKTIERKSNKRWLVSPSGPSFAPDGSFAVVDGPEFMSGQVEPAVIALFGKTGEAKRVVPLPAGVRGYNFALGRDWAVLSSYGPECFLVKLADGQVKRFSLPAADGKKISAAFGFSADGTELRALDSTQRKIHCFALP